MPLPGPSKVMPVVLETIVLPAPAASPPMVFEVTNGLPRKMPAVLPMRGGAGGVGADVVAGDHVAGAVAGAAGDVDAGVVVAGDDVALGRGGAADGVVAGAVEDRMPSVWLATLAVPAALRPM